MISRFLSSVIAGFIFCATVRGAQATAPAATEPLKIVITGIEGSVQARSSAEQPWKMAEVGLELSEGAELRTGLRSAVRFTILPDQTVSLDRLGTLQILRANFENGKIVTDLGMKYGRTRYDIDAQGRVYDAKVHSPSAVLAIRGTKVSLYDQPPFVPQATSLTGRAYFRDIKKQVSFGAAGAGKTVVNEETDSSAGLSLKQTFTDPKGASSGRSDNDKTIQLSLAAYGGKDFSDLGVLTFLVQARAAKFTGTAIGVLPVGRQLFFNLFWTGTPFSDVDLAVTSPLGEVVSISNQHVASSGHYLGSDGNGTNGVADSAGNGQESIAWDISYPPGSYTVKATLKSGATANATVVTTDDPAGLGLQATPVTGTLTPTNPTATGTVSAPLPSASAAKVVARTTPTSTARTTARPRAR
jgi:hypothetical protein